jgi:hypothetical protein
MMSQPKTTRIPAPLYAAAGAGELAYEQLRKLPAVVTELSGKAAAGTVELREKAAATTYELREKAAATLRTANTTAATLRGRAAGGDLDVDRLREAAARNAAAFVAGAQAAQERAVAVYGALVARGERVVGSGVVQAADTVNADLATTEAPAQVAATPADVATAVESKPAAKATRAAAKATKSAAKATKPARGTGSTDAN